MHCEIGKATVGTILDGMEQSELIKRERKEGDRRSLFIFLTDLGRKKQTMFLKFSKKLKKKLLKTYPKMIKLLF